jgi:Uma2 family endonuclease
MVQYDAKLRLPTALELPDSDDTPVDNELQIPVAGVLRAILALLWAQRQDWFFGINMGIYADTENPKTAIVPDGFLCLDVPRFRPEYGSRGRPSYVLWEEDGIVPYLVLEVVSATYGGEYDTKLEKYESLEVPYYVVYDPEGFQKRHEDLEVYRLVDGRYVLVAGEPVWLSEIGLGIGRCPGTVDGWSREWLYWFSEEGERYPVPEEYERYRADLAEGEVEQEREARLQEQEARIQAERQVESERLAKEEERLAREQAEQLLQQERQAKERLAERLRALGVDPDNL